MSRILLKSRKYPELPSALIETLMKGIRASQSEVLNGVDAILVAAEKELADIEREVCPLPHDRVVLMQNGFDLPRSDSLPSAAERDIDICVMARIEARKNQISILRALESLGLGAVFVGQDNPNHKRYCKRFKRMIAASRSTLLDGVPLAEVGAMLRRSRVHVAASWFEVSSLLDVEAYVQGCRVVASKCGGTPELLGDDAYYVDPASWRSIAQQIQMALESSRTGVVNSRDLSAGILDTWEQIGERLLGIYSQCAKEAVLSA